MSLFCLGNFTLHSGAPSKWKIDCDTLTDEDITTLAVMISQLAGSFSSVEGIPRGGLRLATALKSYAVRGVGPHLIVDDRKEHGRGPRLSGEELALGGPGHPCSEYRRCRALRPRPVPALDKGSVYPPS